FAQPPAKPDGAAPSKPADGAAAKPGTPAAPANPFTAFKGNRLSADEIADKDGRDYSKMVRGQDDPPFSADRRKELLDKVPRFLIYRLTWDEMHDGTQKLSTRDIMEGTPAGSVDGIFKMFPPTSFNKTAEDADEQAKRLRQQKYLVEFRAAVVPFLH